MSLLPERIRSTFLLSNIPSELRVNYISNLDLAQTSGGWTGINVAIYNHLAENFDVRFYRTDQSSKRFSSKSYLES